LLGAPVRLRGVLLGLLAGVLSGLLLGLFLGLLPVVAPALAFGVEACAGEGADGGFGLQRADPCSGLA
jgi:hypothetical protein